MAAERAVIMQMMTRKNFTRKNLSSEKFEFPILYMPASQPTDLVRPDGYGRTISSVFIPKKNPINAKGIAKMVWLNLTRLR
jgi:hypothetical protein